jgi:hypothetical protein
MASFGESELLAAMVQALGQPKPVSLGLGEVQNSLVSALSNIGSTGSPFINMVPANFPNWRLAVANARSGTAASKVLFIGTSLTAGQPAGKPALTNSIPAYFNSACNSYVAPSALAGLSLQPGLVSATDPRWTFGANATVGSGSGSLGMGSAGYMKITTAAGTTSYTPGNGNVDTFVIYYASTGVTGTMNFNVDGGANQAIPTTGTTAVHSTTFTVTAGTTHVLNFTAATTSGIFVFNVDCYLSTALGLRVSNAGLPLLGSSNAWTTTNAGDQSLDTIAAYAPVLTVIDLGADDVPNAVPVATFQANLSTLVTTCKLSGDVLIWTAPLNQSATSAALDVAYNSAIFAVANAQGCGVVDVATRFGPWTTWNANGFAFDGTHPNNLGNADIAGAILNALSSVT